MEPETGNTRLPECKPAFDKISWTSKPCLWIYSAGLTIADFVKEDTKLHPLRYPFYAAYLLKWLVPYPPGASTVMTMATVAFAKTRINKYARRLDDHLGKIFDEDSLKRQFKECLQPGNSLKQQFMIYTRKGDFEPDVLKVDIWKLNKHTAVKIGEDSWQATKYAKEGIGEIKNKANARLTNLRNRRNL